MNAVIISDLHLEENREDIYQSFKLFLEQRVFKQTLDEFYILGDFFEVWIGDDYSSPFIERVKDDLKNISADVPKCFFQHGNRDFILGTQFAQEVGFELLDECHRLKVADKNVLLMHGDSLCTRDTEYMAIREFLRSPAFIDDVLAKTLKERMVLADQLRGASKEANAEKSMDIMDVTPEEVVSCLEQHQADVMIHGHTHRPAVHKVSTKHNPDAQRIVMSDWEAQVHYVSIRDGDIALKVFEPKVH